MSEEETGSTNDLRAELEANYDAAVEAEETTPATEVVEARTEAPVVEETQEIPAGRARDGNGRFAPKAEQVAVAAETDFAPPWDLPKDKKEAFAKLPPEAKQIFLERYNEFASWKDQAKADIDRKYQHQHNVNALIDSNREQLAARGLNPDMLLAQALQFDQLVLQDPRAAIRSLCESNDIDPATLYEQQYQADPVTQQLQQELHELRQWRESQEQQSQHYVLQNVTSEIQSFAHEADQSGQPLRPHFQQVYSEMLPIVSAMKQAGPHKPARTILQEAYERAVWSNPETRAAMLQADQTKRTEEQTKKAAAARRAGTTLNGAPGPGLRPAMPNTLRGQLEANWDELFN